MHGAPDNYQVQPKSIIYGLDDMAELAVRQGAVSSIDRLGNVIFFDNFSNGKEAFLTYGNGLNHSEKISSAYFKQGGFSLELIGGSDDLRKARASVYSTYPDPSKMGSEFNLSFNDNVDYIIFWLQLLSADRVYYSEVKLDISNNKLQLSEDAIAWIDIATSLNISSVLYLFHSLKVVADFIKGSYVRLIFDGISYNITAYSLRLHEAAYTPTLLSQVVLYSNSGVNGTIYLDSVIITRNEP